jgi:hypothetical protein
MNEACEKCGKTQNVCRVPVPPDTYERLCGECVSFMLGEAHQLMEQVGERLEAALAEARRAALEEAAQVAEHYMDGRTVFSLYNVAKAIRALHEASKVPLDTPNLTDVG